MVITFEVNDKGDNRWYIGRAVTKTLHREGDLPAVEYANGRKEWYKHGKRHRDGGLPAVEWADGDKEWWVDGVRYYPDRWTVEPKTNDMVGKTCVITMEPVNNDSEVGKCGVCNALGLFTPISEWLAVNETCPHCRSKWTNWIKYVN